MIYVGENEFNKVASRQKWSVGMGQIELELGTEKSEQVHLKDTVH